MNTEKTIQEWLETLPEPHRARALKNNIDDHRGDSPDTEKNTFHSALLAAFRWFKTPEGEKYWFKISCGNYEATPPEPIEEFTVVHQADANGEWWAVSTAKTEYIAHREKDAEKLCEILNKNLADERGEV